MKPPAARRRVVTLSYLRCPVHGQFQCFSVGRPTSLGKIDPDAGGTRVTDGKCCGRWTTIYELVVDADRLIKEIEEASVEVAS